MKKKQIKAQKNLKKHTYCGNNLYYYKTLT